MTQAVSILLCALGGEGGGVLADWLVDVARIADYPAQATSIPGVAQRTGATTYYLEIYPVSNSQLKGQKPVLGLNPLPGRLDALISSELLETARQIGNGFASSDRTCVISSSSRALTTAEKMVMGDGRRQEAPLLDVISANSLRHHVLDMASLCQEAGTMVSAVMLGPLRPAVCCHLNAGIMKLCCLATALLPKPVCVDLLWHLSESVCSVNKRSMLKKF